jgi:hypothetical protein
MTGLILSIVVLATGSIVPDVEAGKPDKETGKPTKDGSDSKSGINFSCTDRKGELNCKASSGDKIGAFSMKFPNGDGIDYTGTCQRSQPFGDSSIETGTYEVRVHECGTDLDFKFEITVDENFKITSIIED